jgi:hypothetical protein
MRRIMWIGVIWWRAIPQAPTTPKHDPTEIWENLEQVHRVRGFATRLALVENSGV